MVRDSHLERLKMIKDEIASKHITRRIDGLNAPSLDKLETSGKINGKSLLRRSVRAKRGGPYINSDKIANEFTYKTRKEDLRIRSSSTCDEAKWSRSSSRIKYPSTFDKFNKRISPPNIRSLNSSDNVNKRRSPPKMKINVDGGSVSLSTDKSIRRSCLETKLQKVNGDSRTLRMIDSKSADSGMKTIRKHLHVRAYKKLFTKHAKTGGNHGDKCTERNSPPQGLCMFLEENTSKLVKDGGDAGNTREGLQEERELFVETIESPEKNESKNTKLLDTVFDARSTSAANNQEHMTTSNGSKCGRMIPNLESDILLEPSGDELYNHGPCEMNMESFPSTLEELGVGAAGVCNSEVLVTNDQQVAEENIVFVPKDSTDAQTIIATMRNACFVCKQPGQLIFCCGKGCKRSYHLACFNPLLHDVPPGVWLCNFCVKKKIDLGVYSVSDGIESVWKLDEGMQSGKRYFVKYKGVAHVHNRWISESELLHDAPSLLANFEKKSQKEIIKWRKEWTEPERLLRKLLISPLEVADEYSSASVSEPLICFIEWFVKWKGLEYDDATWELENSLLLCSSEVPKLIKDYERRHEQASRSYDSLREDKALQVKKDPFYKMPKLPDECPVELDNDHLNSVNCIREFWYKSLNAVLIDREERISKSILFVLSLQPHACRPSLFITTSCYLQQWQVSFVRLAPSMNVIMYQGNKDIRKMIRNLEFYEENGCLLFQVLLADPKAVVEDLVDIACIGWESIIVDECQNSKTIECLEQLNTLNTDFKLLLTNGQLKDSVSEYHVLLSFLSTRGTVNNGLVGLKAISKDASVVLTKLKEKLARYFVFEGKTDSSKFLEYWVPVPLSNVQLEQYCATLFSNARVLRSNLKLKYDVVGALHNILITLRKCCDHPYLVAGELRGLLTKGLHGADFLNAEVCASGKLYLLGKILQEMKDRGLRVVILFQSVGGSEKVSLGDMLDDFLQQKFGVDTYERIETGMVMAMKVTALKKFNNKESGRFAFLLEKRACLPSVKLRSIDAIILFNSDWNPLNDLRSLHKITIESQHNCIRVFRFYTSYTVEEKLLMLAKDDIILENTVESISCNITQLLLGWGSSYLLQMLDQLHSISSPNCISEPSFEKLCLNDVMLEILTQLPGITETNKHVPCSILMKAKLCGGTYSRNGVLMGEKEGITLPDKDMPSFWLGLLEGRHPKWMHISENFQRNRRRNQNANGLTIQAVEGDEVKSKRRKINNITGPRILPEFFKEKGNSFKENHKYCMIGSDGGEQKLYDQRNILMLLGPELAELCDILELPESVKDMAKEFLVYIINNHAVSTHQMNVLQALKISLCWRAASMTSHSMDRGVSLSLAKKYLKFECTEQEAYSVYSKLQILEEKFPCQSGALEDMNEQNILNTQSFPSKTVDDVSSKTVDANPKTVDGRTKKTAATGNVTLRVTDGFPIGETSGKFQVDIGSLKDNLSKDQIDVVEEFFLRRSEDLVQKQQAEISYFKKQMFKDRLKLDKLHNLNVELIHCIHTDTRDRNGKINVLNQQFVEKLDRFDQHGKQQQQKLMSMQLDMRNKEQELKYSWLVKAKTSKMDESLDDIPSLVSRFRLEKFMEVEFVGDCSKPGASTNPSGERNIRSEECLEVPSCILNEWEESGRLGDYTLASSIPVVGGNLEQTVQNRISVGPAAPSERSNALPLDSGISAPLFEVLNTFNSKPANLISSSITAAAFNFKQAGGDDSNDLPLAPNPMLSQGTLFSSESSIEELCTDKHTRPVEALISGNNQDMDSFHMVDIPASDSVVTLASHSEMSRNDEAPSNSTNCTLPPVEYEPERPASEGYQEAALHSHHSVESSELPAQEESIAAVVDSEPSNHQIPENSMHPVRSQEFPSPEGIPSELLRSTVMQYGLAFDWLHSFTQQAEVSIQDVIDAAVFESEPSIQQIPESNLPMIPQEVPSLERTHSEHVGSSGIQPDESNQFIHNFPSIEWIPPQAISADPIRNEIVRVQRQAYSCTKKHENKKLLFKLECEKEIEKIRKKYDILMQDADREYLYEKKMFLEIYQKIIWHNVFAAEIRSNFHDHTEGSSTSFQDSSQNFDQHPQASQVQQLSLSSTAGRPINPRANLHVGRSPAPHLQRLRPAHVSDATRMGIADTPLTSAANSQLASQTLTSTAAPSVPPPILVSTHASPFMEQHVSNACGQIELPLYAGSDDLLESMLANLPAINNEFSTGSVVDSRPNASSDVIYLSDEE